VLLSCVHGPSSDGWLRLVGGAWSFEFYLRYWRLKAQGFYQLFLCSFFGSQILIFPTWVLEDSVFSAL
jgi:hypothetical protein